MDLAWTILTDGRKQYIEQCLPAWIDWLDETISNKFIIDDSGDHEYRSWLGQTFPSFNIIPVNARRSGYARAMMKVLQTIKLSGNKYCLHLEDDFLLKRKFNIQDAITVLESNPNLSQIAFMREPWYHNEIESGGVIQAIERDNPHIKFNEKQTNGITWIEHTAYWTCNPSIIPSWLTQYEWPRGNWTESQFGRKVFLNKKTAGILGSHNDQPYVEHIGREKNGTKY